MLTIATIAAVTGAASTLGGAAIGWAAGAIHHLTKREKELSNRLAALERQERK